jgi:2-polyprenyl-6-methoxyphenol hydroxylase-like FAD-dependent oxidoreductase
MPEDLDARLPVSGAGAAGLALAYWLAHGGFDVTVVERAPALRTGRFCHRPARVRRTGRYADGHHGGVPERTRPHS